MIVFLVMFIISIIGLTYSLIVNQNKKSINEIVDESIKQKEYVYSLISRYQTALSWYMHNGYIKDSKMQEFAKDIKDNPEKSMSFYNMIYSPLRYITVYLDKHIYFDGPTTYGKCMIQLFMREYKAVFDIRMHAEESIKENYRSILYDHEMIERSISLMTMFMDFHKYWMEKQELFEKMNRYGIEIDEPEFARYNLINRTEKEWVI